MREITEIIIHCSATKPSMDIGVEEITDWHVNGNNWSDIGYHYVIRLDGKIEYGRMLDKIGAHCKGHNSKSIGVCYIGGVAEDGKTPKDTRTEKQKETLVTLLKVLKRAHPKAQIHGHRDFANKACPSFDATGEYGADFLFSMWKPLPKLRALTL